MGTDFFHFGHLGSQARHTTRAQLLCTLRSLRGEPRHTRLQPGTPDMSPPSTSRARASGGGHLGDQSDDGDTLAAEEQSAARDALITAEANEEVVYAHHPNGFALQSMRSPELSRMYIQCPNGTDPEDWEEEALWDELDLRLGFKNNRGKIVDKSVASMRSFVCDNMQHGKLFIAGDAAHIVPPTGAKGMNLAVSDIKVLAKGLINHYTEKDDTVLSAYSKICLSRIWKVERFSWWVTTSFHTLENQSEFDTKMQEATLGYLCSSDIGAASFAENYVGLPIYWDAK